MFLGEVILKRRLDMNMTQKKLADGICNQNVISKIERQNTPPAIIKLIEICSRLDLSLNDVYSEFSDKDRTEHIELFKSISDNIFRGELQTAKEKLSILQQSKMSSNEEVQSLFYEAFIMSEAGSASPSFTLDKLLLLTKNNTYNIYTILAYLLKGKLYLDMNAIKDAEYFYTLVQNETSETMDLPNASIEQKIYICKSMANFYIKTNNANCAMEYITRALTIGNYHHCFLYFSELYKMLATITDGATQKKAYLKKSEIIKSLNSDIRDLQTNR